MKQKFLMKLSRINHVDIAMPASRMRSPSIAISWASFIGDPFDMAAQGVRVCLVEKPCEGDAAGT